MKKIFFIIALLISSITLCANQEVIVTDVKSEYVSFSYKNKELIDIINELAQKKGINILLPQGADAITAKATFSLEDEISLDEAWELLISILDLSGYSLVPHGDRIHIIKTDKNSSRQAYDLVVNVAPALLKKSDKKIRYIYYFSNIKVSKNNESELQALFKATMPPDSLFEIDPATNGVILVGRTKEIQAFMEIALKLDRVEFQEKIEFIVLRNANSQTIASLINENVLKDGSSSNRYRLDTKNPSKVPFFSQFTKVIPVPSKNAVIVLGRSQAVERMKDFIKNNLDVDLSLQNDNAKSVLHIYQLQYLDAETFAPILENIINSSRTSGGQSRAGKQKGGTERFFDEVIIKADKPRNAEDLKYYGGNKLIIACRNDDWRQIKKVIEELDSPQPQVLIEVLVADLSIDDTRLLGSNLRTPDKLPLFSNIEFQSAQLNPGIMTDSVSDPMTLHSDLLRQGVDSSGKQANTSVNNVSSAALVASGSTLLSLSDNNGETWSILQVLKLFSHSKILSHPHVIATNNKEAVLDFGQTRRLDDEGSTSLGGSTIVRIKEVEANLTLKITPRISAADMVNLEVEILINNFIEGSDAKTIRTVQTNLNAKDKSIVALGGLVSIDTENATSKTPLLGDVPLIGRFFKRQQGQIVKNSLTIFISPTIIQPRLRGGLNEYTKDYIDVARMYSKQGELFDGLKDPITRWFFKTESESESYIENFVKHDEELSRDLGYDPATVPMPECPVNNKDILAEVVAENDLPVIDKETVLEKIIVADNDTQQTYIAKQNSDIIDLKALLQDDDNPFVS